ncbi:hypothetical protein [Roseateles terrae]|uniref:Uncharacterized protein n=1 Tax=Roseateles terrae TaxID=431060 RepID=A0ABR6GUV8_9BURK|nr:hypothetical protein [Roseateles terrae]MBB3195511.1 hypothetical protein [Roseateles terrae]
MQAPQTTSWYRAVGRALFRRLGLKPRPGVAVETRSFAATHPQTPALATPQPTPLDRRAVPLRVDALREALQARPALREQHGHLVLLEFACATSGDDPFSRLPPRTLDVAIRQLEQAARQSPTLDVLRLQLDRHLQERRSRVEALLSSGDAALAAPTVAPLSAEDRAAAMTPAWRDTVFMDTEPLDRGPDRVQTV